MKIKLDSDLALEAKTLVALAFRNGPIEELHAGRPCAACSGNSEISHITDEQMKSIMKSAVDTLYRLLWQRECDPVAYNENLALGRRYTRHWDDPELKKDEERVTPHGVDRLDNGKSPSSTRRSPRALSLYWRGSSGMEG